MAIECEGTGCKSEWIDKCLSTKHDSSFRVLGDMPVEKLLKKYAAIGDSTNES